MKNSFIVLGILMLSTIATMAQKISADKVPAVVSAAFKTKFPTATNVSWEKENATEYEANFKTGKEEQSAKFDKTGKWLETETEIESAALPGSVSGTIHSQFGDYKIEEAEKVDTYDKGTVYEVELEKGKQTIEVKFSQDGKVLAQKEKKEGKD